MKGFDLIKNNKAFTLVELLVVIAISIVLLGLLLIPIIKTLEANRMTGAYMNAQQNSRQAIQMIRKDISDAMYVASSESHPMLLPVNGLVDSEGNAVNYPIKIQYGVINLVMPKTEFYCSNPDHDNKNPRTFGRGESYKRNGRELAMNACPYCNTDKYVTVTPKLPVEKGNTVVRYFLGLRLNGSLNEPIMTTEDAKHINQWITTSGYGWLPDSGSTSVEGDENQLILYRVEFDPIEDNELFPEEYSLAGLSSSSEEYKRILNLRISDPNVFYHPDCCEAWADICQNVGMLEGVDLAICKDDDYINGHPSIVKSLVSFTPAAISGETPVENSNTTYSQDNQGCAPINFKTKYALLGDTLEISCVRVNLKTQKPIDKWILKNIPNSNNYFGNVYHVSDLDAISPNVGSGDIEFNIADYYNGGSVTDFDQVMAYNYDRDNGIINFAMNPVQWPDLNDNLNMDNLLYMPETETYSYKFNPYKNATVVPGSENVEYYNAYWTDGSNRSFFDLGFNYNALDSEGIEVVKYQRVPASRGFLNYNQYYIDWEEGTIYWKALLNHDTVLGNYPLKYKDIPRIKSYKIQFNHAKDKITVSYLTNQVIDVNINMNVVWDTYKKSRTSSINERVIVGNSLK